MTEENKATVCVYLQDNQSPAEKKFSLNLMINMLSKTKNSNCDILLHATVNHIAEFLFITKGSKLPNVKQFIEMLRLYPHGDILDNTKRQMIAKLSDGIFDESPAKGSHRARSPSLLRQARDTDLRNNRAAQAQTPTKKSSKHVLAGKYKSKRLRTTR